MKTLTLDQAAGAVLDLAGSASTIAIDGRCGSGKTTLARRIQELAGCAVVHMDDFFLRPEQRTPERYAEPGGNVDRERIIAEVLKPLQAGQAVSYRPYDCKSRSLREPVELERRPLTLLEGSYSCHPELWDFCGAHVFLTVEPEEQLERIRRRNGEAAAEVFRDMWIPLEELYFRTFRIEEKCELVVRQVFEQA